jgi:L-asparaginase
MTAKAVTVGGTGLSPKLLTTGGTIATKIDPATGVSRPSMDGSEVARLLAHGDALEVRELDRRPSWTLTLDDMRGIAASIRAEAEVPGRTGLVITVGTSALEYVAYVTDLFVDAPLPIVFTGAMRKADEPAPDGPRNLEDAFIVAGSEESWDRGVLVCFAQRIMSARGVYKQHRSDNDAFIDVGGDAGAVVDGHVSYLRRPTSHRALAGKIDSSVEMVKVYPGASDALLDAARHRGARGVVAEGTPGSGGMPPSMINSLRRLVDDGVVVVISSRAPLGRVPDPPTGGTGSPLSGLPLLSAGDLTSEKAWILLSAALGENPDPALASELFSAVVGGSR